jgi:hypothetical protein
MYSVVEHDALGDIGCTGVDLTQWKRDNRIPLYRGVNTWVMAYTGDPGDFDKVMRSALSDWMKGSGGSADLYTVVGSFDEAQPTQLASSALLSYPQDLKQPYVLSSKNPTRYYKISFRRQSQNDQQVYIGWPVYTDSMFSASDCILDATVGAFYILRPQQLETAVAVDKSIADLRAGLTANIPASQAASSSALLPPATATPWYKYWWLLGGGAVALTLSVVMLRGKRRRG